MRASVAPAPHLHFKLDVVCRILLIHAHGRPRPKGVGYSFCLWAGQLEVAGRAAQISAQMGGPPGRGTSRRCRRALSELTRIVVTQTERLMNQEVVVGLIILLAVGFMLAKLERQRRDSDL